MQPPQAATSTHTITRRDASSTISQRPASPHLRLLASLLRSVSLALLLSFSAPPAAAADHATSLTGNVSNVSTGDLLSGARVEIPALGLSVLTDNTGRYVLPALPAGAHEVVVTYTGLDPVRATVAVTTGQPATRNFDLTTGIYQLSAFTVAAEREGGAAAITAQRNAPNTKNVVAMDSYGNLPNMSASELAILLPGVTAALNLENGIDGFTVRGMGPTLNNITLDGGMLSTQGAMQRQGRINNLTGAMFEGLELIKGHLPDRPADSLGGTINLKSRSPLAMKEKRRLTYNFALRWAPPFTEQIPLREPHRTHPLLNVGWWEVFDVAGGQRNLGVTVNTFYSENVGAAHSTTRDFQNTTTQPAFLWDYNTFDQYNNRKQASVNLKAEYRLSPATKLTFNSIYNDANEMGKLRFTTRAFTNQVVFNPAAPVTGTNATAGIMPGWTDRITTVRQSTASNFDVLTQGPNNFFLRTRNFDLGAEHTLGRWSLDYGGMFSATHINNGFGNDGGQFTMRVTNIGWVLDRTQSDLYPRLTQTAGLDLTKPDSYRLNGFFQNNNVDNDHEVREGRANVKFDVPDWRTFFKTGVHWREQFAHDFNRHRRWSYLGTTLPSDPSIRNINGTKTGLIIPFWYASQFFADRNPINPALWNEDRYWGTMQRFTGTRRVTETVTAGYLMAQGRVKNTGFVTGVRVEDTDTNSWGWVRARVPSTAAQQAADPVGSALRDYSNTRRELRGGYSKTLPSAHLTHDIAPNWKARLSWSTSFGRAPMAQLLPNETINEAQQTLTVNNPALLPQTASNWDAALEYYFEPVGSVTVGWFHKKITDFIVNGLASGTIGTGRDNGYDGEYGGFTRLSSANAGTAFVQGWELSYQQQFTFLPGFLKGLGASVNLTALNAHGDYGGRGRREGRDVEGFVPRVANASVFWRHRGFTSRVIVNYTGESITEFTVGSPARSRYLFARTVINAGIGYQWKPSVTFSIDVNNVTNAPQAAYRGIPDQMQFKLFGGTTVTAGVNGRF
ncbi:MAG: TonB-dependent receptor [Verrucomicrobia bacterium]|nr:TonB-dependent receptor [Verrucomicrobiota bacterium]